MSVASREPMIAEPCAAEGRRRRLLLVAYNFPPVGGAGVQRPVKWVKYLQRWGWDVTVLTTLNPSVPVRDESLLADLPEETVVVRARTWEPDYRVKQNLISDASLAVPVPLQRLNGAIRGLARRCVKMALQPDPQVLWNHHAIRAGKQVLRQHRHDAILVTAPAYSSFWIGTALKRRFGLPLVLDYRDEWDLSGKYLENAQRDWFSQAIQGRMQRHLLRQADAVVATTLRSTQALAEKLSLQDRQIPACCIYNGFDAEDFSDGADTSAAGASESGVSPEQCSFQISNFKSQVSKCHWSDASSAQCSDSVRLRLPEASLEQCSTCACVPLPESGTFRLVYTGTLWNLTDIEPLVRAIEQLNSVQPELVRKLELVCVGRKTPEQQEVLNRLRSTPVRLKSIDYCDHSTALQWLKSADGLCLLLSDVPGAERVVPAKLFEYLAVRKDILAIAPAGETTDIVRRFYPQGQFAPNDVCSIGAWLARRLAGAGPGSPLGFCSDLDFHEYSREAQTGRLAELLDRLVSNEQ